MSEVAAAAKAGTKQHLLQTIEALDEERIAALSYYAAYLRAQEDAEEDAWYLENEEEIEREFESVDRGEEPTRPLREVAAELGIDLEG